MTIHVPRSSAYLLSLMLVVLFALAFAGGPSGAGASTVAAAPAPSYIAYHGTLRDPEGKLLTGSYKLTFRIYNGPTPSDTPLWEEEHADVAARAGEFSVLLGDKTALPGTIFNSPNTFIGITLAGYDEMQPRQRLASTPYSLAANYAESAGRANSAGRADSAGYADNAGRANSAGYADNAGRANTAGRADSATTLRTNDGVLAGVFNDRGLQVIHDGLGIWVGTNAGGRAVEAQSSGDGRAIIAFNRDPAGYAGGFNGNVYVNGTLSKSAGNFKIDHPLDPANKYLSHSFVESPDMMNIYNGNVTLGSEGTAWVQLPSYFETLNIEYRYQLTAIGAPGPDLYIAEEIRNLRFKIAGGKSGIKVSWQVTGIRNDAYARDHRIVVEEDKPQKEKSTYLYPEGVFQNKTTKSTLQDQPLRTPDMPRQAVSPDQLEQP